MHDIAFTATNLSQDGLCDVILGRSQPTSRNDDSVPGKGLQKYRRDLVPVVADGNHPFDVYSGLFQGL